MDERSSDVVDSLSALAATLADHGLILRGGFSFLPDETAPPGPSGTSAKSVLLVGQAATRPGRISCAGGNRSPLI